MRFAQEFIQALGTGVWKLGLLRVHSPALPLFRMCGPTLGKERKKSYTEPNTTKIYSINQEKPLQSARNRAHTILQLGLWNPTWRRNRNAFANEYIMKCSSLASISYLLLWLDRQILGVWPKPQAYSKYIRLWSFAFCVRHILQASQQEDRFALVYALDLLLKVIHLWSAEWNGSIHCWVSVTEAAVANLLCEFGIIKYHWSASV